MTGLVESIVLGLLSTFIGALMLQIRAIKQKLDQTESKTEIQKRIDLNLEKHNLADAYFQARLDKIEHKIDKLLSRLP